MGVGGGGGPNYVTLVNLSNDASNNVSEIYCWCWLSCYGKNEAISKSENKWINEKNSEYGMGILIMIRNYCIPVTVYVMSKVLEKFASQKIRTKPKHIVIKSYTSPTISNRLNYIIQFSWMSVFFAEEDSNLGNVPKEK